MWLHQLFVVPVTYKRGYKLLKISPKKWKYQKPHDQAKFKPPLSCCIYNRQCSGHHPAHRSDSVPNKIENQFKLNYLKYVNNFKALM